MVIAFYIELGAKRPRSMHRCLRSWRKQMITWLCQSQLRCLNSHAEITSTILYNSSLKTLWVKTISKTCLKLCKKSIDKLVGSCFLLKMNRLVISLRKYCYRLKFRKSIMPESKEISEIVGILKMAKSKCKIWSIVHRKLITIGSVQTARISRRSRLSICNMQKRLCRNLNMSFTMKLVTLL